MSFVLYSVSIVLYIVPTNTQFTYLLNNVCIKVTSSWHEQLEFALETVPVITLFQVIVYFICYKEKTYSGDIVLWEILCETNLLIDS